MRVRVRTQQMSNHGKLATGIYRNTISLRIAKHPRHEGFGMLILTDKQHPQPVTPRNTRRPLSSQCIAAAFLEHQHFAQKPARNILFAPGALTLSHAQVAQRDRGAQPRFH